MCYLIYQAGLRDNVDLLLSQAHSSLHARTRAGATAAHLAAQHGHAALLRYLLEKGCSLASVDSQGKVCGIPCILQHLRRSSINDHDFVTLIHADAVAACGS